MIIRDVRHRRNAMQPMKHTFIMLKWCGLWRDPHVSSNVKTKLYSTYTWFVVFLLITVILSLFMELAYSVTDIDGFVDNAFMLVIIVADCGKAINILLKRDDIIRLTNRLGQNPFRSETVDEIVIQRKFDRIIRLNTLVYSTIVSTAVIVALISSAVKDIPRRTLPYKTWMPFDYEQSLLAYTLVYTHQILGILFGATISMAFDTLIIGLMMQTCAQLNILMHRFEKMPHAFLEIVGELKNDDRTNTDVANAETTLISQRVQHHLAIFEFAKKTNDLFSLVIFLQYAVSVSVLCANLLRLSKEKIFSFAFIELMVYLSEMTVQILIYCYYGGDVAVESLKVCDAIYDMNWPALSIRARRSLLTIMTRTLRPIKFTTAHVITLNLESFKSLVKLSYSTYNVL